jgi:MFS family permease
MLPISSREKRDLQLLFYLFGLGVMCLAPRLPDIKENLGVSTTYFGFLTSIGSIGAFTAHLTMGHVIHRLGVYRVLVISATMTYLSIGALISLRDPAIYLIVNILSGFSWASYHLAINAQALHRQAESRTQIIPMLHGLWSAGAVTTAFIALLVSSTLSLNWHVYPLISIVLIFKLRSINRLKPILLQGEDVTEDDEVLTLPQLIRDFQIDWVVTLGFLCALILEFSIGDWATILARREFGVSKSIAVIPYFLFMSAMIIGRLSYQKFRGDRSDKEIVQPFVITGGTVFLASLFLGLQIKDSNLFLGFAILCLGFFLTGLGISFAGPLFFGYASLRSDKPAGVAVAELGALNQIMAFFVRGVISIVAGALSLPIALIIPGAMLIFVAFFVAAASEPKRG